MIQNILIIHIDGRIAFYRQYESMDITPDILQEFIETYKQFEQEVGSPVDLPIHVKNIKFLYTDVDTHLLLLFAVDISDEDDKIKEHLQKARDLLINKYSHEIASYIHNPVPVGEAFHGFAKELDNIFLPPPLKIYVLGSKGVGKSTILQLLGDTNTSPVRRFPSFLGGTYDFTPFSPIYRLEVLSWPEHDKFKEKFDNQLRQALHLMLEVRVLLVTDSTLKNVLETRDLLDVVQKYAPSVIIWAIANKQDLPGALSSRDVARALGIPTFSMVAIDPRFGERVREIWNCALRGTLPKPDWVSTLPRLSPSKQLILKKILQPDSPIRETQQKTFYALKEAEWLLQSDQNYKKAVKKIKKTIKLTRKLAEDLLKNYQKIFEHPKYVPESPDQEELRGLLRTAVSSIEIKKEDHNFEPTDGEELTFPDSEVFITYLKDLTLKVITICDHVQSIFDSYDHIHEIDRHIRDAVNYANYLGTTMEEHITRFESPKDQIKK